LQETHAFHGVSRCEWQNGYEYTVKKIEYICYTVKNRASFFYINFKVLPFMITNVAWLRLNHTSPISYGQVSRSADEL
jgi:hypothetical protein